MIQYHEYIGNYLCGKWMFFFHEKKQRISFFFSTKKWTQPFVDIWEGKKYDSLAEFEEITCIYSQLQWKILKNPCYFFLSLLLGFLQNGFYLTPLVIKMVSTWKGQFTFFARIDFNLFGIGVILRVCRLS